MAASRHRCRIRASRFDEAFPRPACGERVRVRGTLHRPSSLRVPDRKSTRLNSSHLVISYAVFCLKKKKTSKTPPYKSERANSSDKANSSQKPQISHKRMTEPDVKPRRPMQLLIPFLTEHSVRPSS